MDAILERFPAKDPLHPNLEELFTLLDLSLLAPDTLKQVDKARWKQTRGNITGMIVAAFLNYQWDLGQVLAGHRPVHEVDADRSDVERVIDAWGVCIKPGDDIISFNWDLLHEVALWRSGKWSFLDGYGFTCRNAGTDRCSQVQLYKLHGSVNWVQDEADDPEPNIVDRQEFFSDVSESTENFLKEAGQRDQGRKLIIPTYLKAVSANTNLVKLWNKAAAALQAAKEIVVIGYRLHPADSLAHHLFVSSLLANPNHPVVKIVSRAADDEWDTVCMAAGLRTKRIRERFEEWVATAE